MLEYADFAYVDRRVSAHITRWLYEYIADQKPKARL